MQTRSSSNRARGDAQPHMVGPVSSFTNPSALANSSNNQPPPKRLAAAAGRPPHQQPSTIQYTATYGNGAGPSSAMPTTTTMTVEHAISDARALELEAHTHDLGGRDMDAIRMMERALLLRLQLSATSAATGSFIPRSSHHRSQGMEMGGDGNDYGDGGPYSPLETCRAAERLVIKCNSVAVTAFKNDDYSYSLDLLENAMRITAPPNGLVVPPATNTGFGNNNTATGGITDPRSGPFYRFPAKRIALRGTTLNNLACLERRRGRLVAALDYIKQSVDNSKQQSPASFLNLSAILNEMGNAPEAVGAAKKAVSLLERNAAQYSTTMAQQGAAHLPSGGGGAADSPTSPIEEYNSLIAIAYHNLGAALESVDLHECVKAFERGFAAAMATLGPDAGTTRAIQQQLFRLQQRGLQVSAQTHNTANAAGNRSPQSGSGAIGPLFLPAMPNANSSTTRGGKTSPPSRNGTPISGSSAGVNILASTATQAGKLRPPGTARDYGVSNPRTARPTTSPSTTSAVAAGAMLYHSLGGGGGQHASSPGGGGRTAKLVPLSSADVFASIAQAKSASHQQRTSSSSKSQQQADPSNTTNRKNNNNDDMNTNIGSISKTIGGSSMASRRVSGETESRAERSVTGSVRSLPLPLLQKRANDEASSFPPRSTRGGVAKGTLRSGSQNQPSPSGPDPATTATALNKKDAAALAQQMSVGEYVALKAAKDNKDNGETNANGEAPPGATPATTTASSAAVTMDIVTFAHNRLSALLAIEQQFERRYKAAQRIQRMFRVHRSRKIVATRLALRKQAIQTRIETEDHSARVIQRSMKRLLARRRALNAILTQKKKLLAIQNKSAADIQRGARRWLRRRETSRRTNFNRKHAKALQLLQNWFRQQLAKAKVGRMRSIRDTLVSTALTEERRQKAALDIQRVWRNAQSSTITCRAKGERKVASEKETAQRRSTMAAVIQRMWRGFLARRRAAEDRERRSSRTSLAAFALEERHAVTILQAFAFGIIARRQMTPLFKQSRERKSELLSEVNKDAATIIQKLVRCVQAKVRVRQMRAAKKGLLTFTLHSYVAKLIQSVGQGFGARRFLGIHRALGAAAILKKARLAADRQRDSEAAEALAAKAEAARLEAVAEAANEAAKSEVQRAMEAAIATEKATNDAALATWLGALQQQRQEIEDVETTQRRDDVEASEHQSLESSIFVAFNELIAAAVAAEEKRRTLAMLREKGLQQFAEDEEARRKLGYPTYQDGDDVESGVGNNEPTASNQREIEVSSSQITFRPLPIKKSIAETQKEFASSVGYIPNKNSSAGSRRKLASASAPPTKPVTATKGFLDRDGNTKLAEDSPADADVVVEAEAAPIPAPKKHEHDVGSGKPIEPYTFSAAHFERQQAKLAAAATTIQAFVKGSWDRRHYASLKRELAKYVELLIDRDAADDLLWNEEADDEHRFEEMAKTEVQQQQKPTASSGPRAAVPTSVLHDGPAPSSSAAVAKREYPEDILARRYAQRFGELSAARSTVGGDEAIAAHKLRRQVAELIYAFVAAREATSIVATAKGTYAKVNAAATAIQGLAKIAKAKKERAQRQAILSQRMEALLAQEEDELEEDTKAASEEVEDEEGLHFDYDSSQSPKTGPILSRKSSVASVHSSVRFAEVKSFPKHYGAISISDEKESEEVEFEEKRAADVHDEGLVLSYQPEGNAAEYDPALKAVASAVHDDKDKQHLKVSPIKKTASFKISGSAEEPSPGGRHSEDLKEKFHQMIQGEGAVLKVHDEASVLKLQNFARVHCMPTSPRKKPTIDEREAILTPRRAERQARLDALAAEAEAQEEEHNEAIIAQVVTNKIPAPPFSAPIDASSVAAPHHSYNPALKPATSAVLSSPSGIPQVQSNPDTEADEDDRRQSPRSDEGSEPEAKDPRLSSFKRVGSRKASIKAVRFGEGGAEMKLTTSADRVSIEQQHHHEEFEQHRKELVHDEGLAIKLQAPNGHDYDPSEAPAPSVLHREGSNNMHRRSSSVQFTTKEALNHDVSKADTLFVEKSREIDRDEGNALLAPPAHDYDPTMRPSPSALHTQTSSPTKSDRRPSVQVVVPSKSDESDDDKPSATTQAAQRHHHHEEFEQHRKELVHDEGLAIKLQAPDGHDYDPSEAPAPSVLHREGSKHLQRRASNVQFGVVETPKGTTHSSVEVRPSGESAAETEAFKEKFHQMIQGEGAVLKVHDEASVLKLQNFARVHCMPTSPRKKPTIDEREAILTPRQAERQARLDALAAEAEAQEEEHNEAIIVKLGLTGVANTKKSSEVNEPEPVLPAPTITASTASTSLSRVPKPPSTDRTTEAPNAPKRPSLTVTGAGRSYLPGAVATVPIVSSTPNSEYASSEYDSDQAAGKIQRAYKGHTSRKIVAAKREEHQEKWRHIKETEEDAARKIQDGMRIAKAKRVRRELKKEHDAQWERRRQEVAAEEAEAELEELSEAERQAKSEPERVVSPQIILRNPKVPQQPAHPLSSAGGPRPRMSSASAVGSSQATNNNNTSFNTANQFARSSSTVNQNDMPLTGSWVPVDGEIVPCDGMDRVDGEQLSPVSDDEYNSSDAE